LHPRSKALLLFLLSLEALSETERLRKASEKRKTLAPNESRWQVPEPWVELQKRSEIGGRTLARSQDHCSGAGWVHGPRSVLHICKFISFGVGGIMVAVEIAHDPGATPTTTSRPRSARRNAQAPSPRCWCCPAPEVMWQEEDQMDFPFWAMGEDRKGPRRGRPGQPRASGRVGDPRTNVAVEDHRQGPVRFV